MEMGRWMISEEQFNDDSVKSSDFWHQCIFLIFQKVSFISASSCNIGGCRSAMRSNVFTAPAGSPSPCSHACKVCTVTPNLQAGQFLIGDVIVGKTGEDGQFDESVHDGGNLTTFVDSGQSTGDSPPSLE
jgi:hypothetical protein